MIAIRLSFAGNVKSDVSLRRERCAC